MFLVGVDRRIPEPTPQVISLDKNFRKISEVGRNFAGISQIKQAVSGILDDEVARLLRVVKGSDDFAGKVAADMERVANFDDVQIVTV